VALHVLKHGRLWIDQSMEEYGNMKRSFSCANMLGMLLRLETAILEI
jgi:hypothetical protein